MSDHLKRLNAPDSWHIAKKTTKFITKTAPGPHNANAMPIAVWLRDHMDYARNLKEVKQIQLQVLELQASLRKAGENQP